ncbi:MAG: hypothetical protein R1F52_01885 [Candidatus Nitrosoabyssus spongiisocia]|nr:MAG: hypothetical protein R1F52_01885 [Nitrosopumilaceae archaeon AB1(1)]
MESAVYVNVSTTDYENASNKIKTVLTHAQEMTHGEDRFVITDSEFAFGWHFFVVGVSISLVQRLMQQMGDDFQRLKGKGTDEKFLTWMKNMIGDVPRLKIELKEKMESSKFGIF